MVNPHATESFFWFAIVHTAAALTVGLAGGILIEKVINRWTAALTEEAALVGLLGTAAKYTIFGLGCVSALSGLGFHVQSILAGIGLTGFAVGFALKDALANIIAGVFILLYKPFKLGQDITVSSFKGKVKDIDLRYTHLENETDVALIPNSVLFTTLISISKTRQQ